MQYAVIGCRLKNANEGCNSCASLAGLVSKFYCMFYFTCDRSLKRGIVTSEHRARWCADQHYLDESPTRQYELMCLVRSFNNSKNLVSHAQ